MILADKIIDLRKKAGWSQDELASKLNVTRQSVSKWEGAQSIPDMERIVRMSRLFGVTTDYLLKDELETEEFSSADADTGTSLRRVSMEQASNYLALRKAAAPRIALATLLCIVSPIVLIVLACACESSYFGISEDAAAGIGLCVMFCIVAAAVVIFIRTGHASAEFEFLEKEEFETEYGVAGMVKERKKEFGEQYSRLNAVGTALCILSVLPIFASLAFSAPYIWQAFPSQRFCLLPRSAAMPSYAQEFTTRQWISFSRRATTRARTSAKTPFSAR